MRIGRALQLRSLRSFLLPRRSFADKGPDRKDFTDRGFQEQGYIHEDCFHSSTLRRFKAPRDYSRTPWFAGFDENERDYRARARREAEERKIRVAGDDGRVFEDAKKDPHPVYHRKRNEWLRSRREEGCHTNFAYEGSGLDEYTRKAEARAKRRSERLLEAAYERESKLAKFSDDGDAKEE